MYRPTVRYADVYREYVDRVFQATSLDRNQIIRLALFTAAHSEQFQRILRQHTKGDVPLPSPDWSPTDHRLWREQNPTAEEERRDVNVGLSRRTEATPVARIDSGSRTGTKGRDVSDHPKEGCLRPIRSGDNEIKIRIG